MAKKEFIMEDGKIRSCSSNIAKMNIWEHVVFKRFYLDAISETFAFFFETLGMFIGSVIALIFSLLVILAFPITFPLISYRDIKRHKKECKI